MDAQKNKPLPTFITERLILRAVQRRDIPSYQKYFADYEVIRHLASHVPWPYPSDGAEWFLENMIFPDQGKDQWLWGIFEKQNPTEVIGGVHLFREGRPENRGFWLGKKFWGKGYMTEAVAPVMTYAFDGLGFEKLIFANAVGNTRSGRVKEKTNAKLIDRKPAKFVDPQYVEHEIWEFKKQDWNETAQSYFISSEKSLLNLQQTHALLVDAYWCKGIPKMTLSKAIENSICFGVYKAKVQIGFARVVTDKATFAWLCDVIIAEKHRGRGLAKELVKNVLLHPELQGLRRLSLATKDAHGLYQQFGFQVTATPQNWMEIKDNDIYLKESLTMSASAQKLR